MVQASSLSQPLAAETRISTPACPCGISGGPNANGRFSRGTSASSVRIFTPMFHTHYFIITNITLVNNAMDQTPPLETNSSTASQIFRTLWNTRVYCLIDNSPSPVPILSHMNPVHALPTDFLKDHFNIILPSTCRSPELYKTSTV